MLTNSSQHVKPLACRSPLCLRTMLLNVLLSIVIRSVKKCSHPSLTYVAPVCGCFLLASNYKISLSGVFILDKSDRIYNSVRLSISNAPQLSLLWNIDWRQKISSIDLYHSQIIRLVLVGEHCQPCFLVRHFCGGIFWLISLPSMILTNCL